MTETGRPNCRECSLNADLMTDEQLHAKLQKGYDDIAAGRVVSSYEPRTRAFKRIEEKARR